MMEGSIQPQLDHFGSIPWCKKLLERPNQVFTATSSRQTKHTSQLFFSKVLNNAGTLPHFLVFYDRPSPGQAVSEVRTLITLGGDVAGHKGICHGGVVMSLLDEVAGELGGANQETGAIPHKMLVTAYLNTKFMRPLMVPSTVFAKSWATKMEERKYYVEVVIEDENGVALASADAMFMAVREKGKL